MKHPIALRVNGRAHQDEVDERQLLVYHLRESLGLTGVHIGCVIGECGACSVLIDGELVKSCLHLAVQADDREVTTVEGLAPPDAIGAVQQAFVEEYGLQCGYCTPGMVLAAHALLSENPDPSEDEVRESLAGNVCMCTGYVQIVEAVLSAARMLRQAGEAGPPFPSGGAEPAVRSAGAGAAAQPAESSQPTQSGQKEISP